MASVAVLIVSSGCSKRTSEGIDRVVSGSVYGDVIPVEVAVINAEPFDEQFDVAGQVEAKELVTVSAQLNERVASVRREIGDQVRRGQILVTLESRSVEAQVSKVEAQLARARTDLAWAEKELKRQKKLYADLVTAERVLDDAQRTVDTQRVEVQAQEAELELAKISLDRTMVHSPLSGAVAKRYVSAGEYVSLGTPLIDIVSKRLLFVLSVAERDVVSLEPGIELLVRVDALADPVPGKVLAISPSGNQQTRTFRVEIELDDVSVGLSGVLPGMSGRTNLTRESYEAAILLPESAVLRDGTASYVYVLDRERSSAIDDSDGERDNADLATVRRVSVTLWSQVGSRVVAAPSLPPGAEVVVVGQSAVQEGSKVRVRRRHETLIERRFQ